MEITVLLENSKFKNSNLNIEHGLSIFIKKNGNNILFDAGGLGESAIKNAEVLGIDLFKIDVVVISHGHNDHTGGLLKFLQINDKAPVYLKREALNSHYSKRPEGLKYIGMDDQIAKKYTDRLNFVDKTVKIAEGLFLVPDIMDEFSIPSSNCVLYVKENGELVRDDFKHELFMIIEKNDNLVIFSGCGHSGIRNIVNTARDVLPDRKIESVIGGFHFQAGSLDYAFAEKEEIEDTAEWLKNEVDGQIYTGHCTGKRGINLMKPILKDRLERIYTGMKISF